MPARFEIELSQRAWDNLEQLRKRDQQIILDRIEAQLSHEPDKPTRNRKKLADNLLAPWELRAGEFRIFYDIVPAESLVVILAIGRKNHNRLLIGGEEISL